MMCVCYRMSQNVSHKLLVTKHNKQSKSFEQSTTLEEMGAERSEILVFKNPLIFMRICIEAALLKYLIFVKPETKT